MAEIDETKIESVLIKWGVTQVLGFAHKLAIAIKKKLEEE